jgi:4-amino-4-deoxy-L-arabinose transferase-like glycosyltransferase
MNMRRRGISGTSALPIEARSLAGNINWLLITAVILTLLNGLVISLWIFPAISIRAELVSGPSDGWAEIAENIVQGNGFVYQLGTQPTATTGYLTREPVYALFLASILAVFGSLEPYMMLLQCLINALTCFVLYFVVRKSFGRDAAMIACFGYALYPFASWYVPRIAYETLLGFLVTLMVLGLVDLFENLSFRRSVGFGLLLGITILCKGTYLLLPFALIPALMIRFGIWNSRAIKCWVTIVFVVISLLTPWVIRNYAVSGQFIPVTTHGAIAFLYGNKVIEHYSFKENTAGELPGEESTRLYNNVRDSISSRNPHFSRAEVEVQIDKELAGLVVTQFLEEPGSFIKKMLLGLVFVWFLGDTGIKSNALLLMQGPLVLLSLLGIFHALKTKRAVLPLLTVLFYFVLIQTAFSSLGRFSYPMVPILMAFAAYSIQLLRAKYLPSASRLMR